MKHFGISFWPTFWGFMATMAETVGVVSDALRRQPVTALDTRELFAPAKNLGPGPYVQLWPHRHGTDAMFAAALRKGT